VNEGASNFNPVSFKRTKAASGNNESVIPAPYDANLRMNNAALNFNHIYYFTIIILDALITNNLIEPLYYDRSIIVRSKPLR
jgi:hypothetical protein